MAPCNDLGRQGWRHGAVWGARGGAIQRFGAPGVAPYKSMQLHTPSARRELLEGRWVLPKGLQICMTLLIVMPMLCCVYKLHVQTQWNSHVAILDSVPNENAHRSPQCMHKLLMAYNMCGRYKYASYIVPLLPPNRFYGIVILVNILYDVGKLLKCLYI